jgi:hypothetical protein
MTSKDETGGFILESSVNDSDPTRNDILVSRSIRVFWAPLVSGWGIGFSAQACFFALAAVARWPLTWLVADEPAIRPFGTIASL